MSKGKISFSTDFIFSKRKNQIVLTSLSLNDPKIYTFEGACADLIEHLTHESFREEDYSKMTKLVAGEFSFEDWKNLLKFCLEEKIFLKD